MVFPEPVTRMGAGACEHERNAGARQGGAVESEQPALGRDLFLQWLSHEVRTPATVVTGLASVLRQRGDQLDVEARAAVYDDLYRNAFRLSRLLEDILELAKGTDEKPAVEPMLVGPIVTMEALRSGKDYGVRVVPELESGIIVIGHADQFGRALRGMFRSLAACVEPGTSVQVDGRSELPGYRLEFTVSGAASHMGTAGAFAPFLHPESVTLNETTQVGPLVARRLIERQGGSVGGALEAGQLHLWLALPMLNERETFPVHQGGSQ